MNRSFRSIWNPSLGTFVAAAETQPSRGRTVSGTRTARRQAYRASAGPLVMEPRIVFDAAIAATVADVQPDAGSDTSAAEAAAEWVVDDGVETADAADTAEAVDTADSADTTDSTDTTDSDPQATAPEQAPLREIIFVDPVASSLGSHLQDSGAEIIYLSADRDGVEQIAEALQGQTNIAAIHIVSHGVEGRLMLGNTVLDTASMQAQHQQALQAIGTALSEEGDILIYGCNFTAGETGLTAATLLAEITGADVAASVDATGHADKNGNWTLETSIGHVEAVALSPSDWMGRLDLLIQNQGTVGTNALASAIMGPGVTINSATYFGGSTQAGVFSTGAGISFGSNILEFTDGAIFTTHSSTSSVAGPNNNAGLSSNAPSGIDNNPDFNAASGGFNTFDASFIVINFTPDVFPGANVGDVGRMTASLVFGSEEYNEYVYSGFNDTIGLWVNGVNVALAPNGLAIGIDTINDAATFNPANGSASNDPNPGHSTTSFTSANPNLYVNNSTNTYNTQMDGFTVTISLTFDVIVGQQNTIKLGIADTGDASLDSWLFVKAQSLQTAFVPENDSVSTPANVPASVNLTANDFNLNGGALDIIAINGDAISPGGSVVLASGVTVTLDGGGNVTVSGDGMNAVSDTFTYTVQNQDGQTGNAIVTVNITAPVLNNAPVAVDDSFAAGEDDAAAVRGNALSNDSDPDGNPLTAVAQTNVAGSNGGLFSINAAGQVTFNPNGAFNHLAAGQTTTTSFTYTVSDGQGGTDTATVTVTVTGANDAPVAVDDSFGVGEDAVATVVGNALSNDTDVDGGTLAATPQTGVVGTGGGLFSINAAGQVTFNPNGEFEHLAAGQTATTSFTYTVSDGQGGSDTATVTVTVTGANDAPVLDLDADGSDSASGFLVTGPNLIVNGDFSAGNTGFSSDYATGPTSGVLANEETYFIGDASVDWMPHWGQDNVTADPYGDPSGEMMYINGSPTAGQVYWRQTVAVTPGTDYQFSVWATNVNHWEGFSGTGDADPLVELSINGVLVGSGRLSYLNAGVWQQLSGVWSSGGATSATLTMSSAAGIAMGNDLAVTGFSLAEGFIVGVNDYETAYHEGGAGIAVVDSDVLVQDTDSTQLVSATVVLTQAFDGDTLSVDGALPAGVLANVDNSVPGQITVQLTGAASLADYQAALLAIRFSSSSENPDESLRVLEVTVNDGNDTSNLARTFITVTSVNDAPALVPGSQPGAQTGDDGQLITPLDVSGAFTDVDGDTLGYSASGLPPGLVIDPVTGVISGTLTSSASQGGPANDGVYSVTVTATDPSGATVDSVFSWTVGNPAPVAVNDDFAAGEDDGAAVVGNALTNDSDPDGDTLNVTPQVNVAGTGGGLFSINASGQVTFDPNGEFEGLAAGQTATTSFTYTVSDGQGGSDTATVTVTVTGANDAPVALDDAVSTDEDTPLNIDVLANDSDTDGDTLTVTSASAGHGTVVINPDGTITYTPDADFHGSDTISYTISDGQGGTATATVSITVNPVNDAPALVPGSQPGAQSGDDGQLMTPLDVSGAFTDVDGDTLGYSASGLPPGLVIDPVTGVISGTLTSSASQGGPANDGVYSVTVTATDPSGATVDSVFSWTVGNPAPVAVNDDFAAGEDDGAAVVGNALTNDSDPDGDTLNVTPQVNVAGTGGGLFSIDGAGVVTFDPNREFEGLAAGQTATTSFTYTVSDGQGGSDTATVTVTVTGANDAPVALDDAVSTDEDTPLNIDVLANDSDTDGDTLTVTSASAGHGTVVINPDGTITYTPDADFHGSDTISYTISDGQGGTATATVSITVNPVNDAPVAVDDGPFVVTPGRSVTGNVLTNDSDVDGDTLSVTGFAVDTDRDGVADSFLPGQTAVIRGVGTLVVQADGSFVFTPASGYAGNVPVASYTVSDGHAQSTASLRFEPVPEVALPPAPAEPPPAPAPAPAPAPLPTVTQPTELGAQAAASPVPPAAVSSGAVAPVLHVLYAVNTAHTEGFIVASGLSLGTSDPLLAEAMAQAPDGLLFEGMAEASAASLLAPDGLHAGAPSLHVQHAVRHEPVTTEHGSYVQRVVRSTQMESRLGDAVIRAQTELHMAEDALDLMRMALDAQGSAADVPAVAPEGSGTPPAAPGAAPDGVDRQPRGSAPVDTSVVEDERVMDGQPSPEPAEEASKQPTPPAPTALGFRAQLARMAQEQGGWGRPVTRAVVAA